MSLIPGCGIGVREKIIAKPSVVVEGKAHVRGNKHVNLASSKKTTQDNRDSSLTGSKHSKGPHIL